MQVLDAPNTSNILLSFTVALSPGTSRSYWGGAVLITYVISGQVLD